MANRSLNRQTGNQSKRSGTAQCAQAIPAVAIEMPIPGVLSFLVPTLLPLIVLAIMMASSMSLERRPSDSLTGHTPSSPITVSTVKRSVP